MQLISKTLLYVTSMDYFQYFFQKQAALLKGCYLAVVLEPHKTVLALSKTLQNTHDFLPMHLANPPRAKDTFHSTIAFFRDGVSGEQIERLKNQFEGSEVHLTLTGYGKASKGDDQALYFTLQPGQIIEIRKQLQMMGLSFMATDPHITFGVHMDTQKDVHGVSKLQQFEIEPIEVVGKVHLKQGTRTVF